LRNEECGLLWRRRMGKNKSFQEWEAELIQDPEFVEEAEKIKYAYQIIRLRLKRGLTQAQLAKIVGTKQSSIARLESGKIQPRLSFLRRVVKALDGDLELEIRGKEELQDKHKEDTSTVVVQVPIFQSIYPETVRIKSTGNMENTQYVPYPHEEILQ